MMSQIPLARALDARCLLFDSYGMMWIGTEQGLLRYDGYSFRNFRSDAYSPACSIPREKASTNCVSLCDGLKTLSKDTI